MNAARGRRPKNARSTKIRRSHVKVGIHQIYTNTCAHVTSNLHVGHVMCELVALGYNLMHVPRYLGCLSPVALDN